MLKEVMGHAAPVPSRVPAAARGFALLSPAFLDELRARLTLSTIVGRTVRLKKAGNEYKACCPFHQEKTPSFWVNDQKGFYHCFGCGAHGDAIRFLTETQGLAFMDAVRELADGAGLELPKADPATQERQQRALSLIDVMEQAARVFEKGFAGIEGGAARAYADARGLSPEARATFRLGYAADSRTKLRAAMPGVEAAALIEAGLLIDVEGREPYDRFRGRLMVPIRDPRGRVIAFGGRVIGEGEPKYLNSPETPLFDKGRTLFNLDRAGPASRRSGRLFVVEGYLDAIALDMAGIREAVAPLGTALTEHQLELLWRCVDEPTLCFDGDAAGRKAAVRAAERALAQLRSGKSLAVALLPAGQDPDDLVCGGGAAAFEAVVAAAQPLHAFLYAAEAAAIDRDRPEGRATLRARLEELARTCEDRFVADEYARSFRALFFEDFGWKKPDRDELLKRVVRTSPRHAPDLTRSYIRSALFGLTRFPSVLAANMDAVDAIPIAHPDLRRWRDVLVRAVIADPHLDDDGIEAILLADVQPEVRRVDLTTELRFGFNRGAADRDAATTQLEALIALLGEEHELADEMAALDKAALADAGGDGYEAIESARRQVRDARADMLRRGIEWNGEEFE